TGAAPPHLVRTDGRHVRHGYRQGLPRPPLTFYGRDQDTSEHEPVDRCVGNQAELLIEEKSWKSTHQISRARLRVRAIGCSGIWCAVYDHEESKPHGGTDQRNGGEREQPASVSNAKAHTNGCSNGEYRKASLQPWKNGERSAGDDVNDLRP